MRRDCLEFAGGPAYIGNVVERTLPLFPLPVVLFPGVARPLHVFEPRYRRLLADCLQGDRRFGLPFCVDGDGERDLPAGHVGCVASIESAEPLPDGRSNIVISGQERFALVRYVDAGTPYLVGEVVAYPDLPEPPAELEAAAAHVRSVFARVVRAARTIADNRTPVPTLPNDPALVAYHIASVIDMPLAARQELLGLRSAIARLAEITRVLDRVIGAIEQGATQHTLARGNGHGPAGGNGGGGS